MDDYGARRLEQLKRIPFKAMTGAQKAEYEYLRLMARNVDGAAVLNKTRRRPGRGARGGLVVSYSIDALEIFAD